MRRLPIVAFIFCASLAASAVRAAASDDEAIAARHGWRWLVDKLAADGVPRAEAAAAFADPRLPAFDGLWFALAPRESSTRYRQLRSPASVRAAERCRARYASAFRKAEEREGVPAGLIAAIVHVESSCGNATGSSNVLHRLARLAMANEPANLARNVVDHAGEPPDPAIAAVVRERAAYLERTFYPEVRGVFTMAERLRIDPLAMEGSGAGAFGFPQFLPTSYLRYGVDGNDDGRVSLYDMDDAAASCARFLAGNGWRAGLTLPERRRVIWQYNRSDAYIDTVLALHRQIEAPAPVERNPRVARNELRKRRAR
ncbi:MAG: lytic murein transglycosylase [Deltaproteobacteria bacterium]|nr:lytic murein transglycosylase [Deltaproteobacteria bacterium]